jgi:hypothetical protein
VLTVRSIFVAAVAGDYLAYRYCLPTDLPGVGRRTRERARVDRKTELTWHERDGKGEGVHPALYNRPGCDRFYKPRYARLDVFYGRGAACRFLKPGIGGAPAKRALCRRPERRILHRASGWFRKFRAAHITYPVGNMCARSPENSSYEIRPGTLWTSEGQWFPPLSPLAAGSSSETRFARREFVVQKYTAWLRNPLIRGLISFRLKWLCRRDPEFSVMVGVAELVTVARSLARSLVYTRRWSWHGGGRNGRRKFRYGRPVEFESCTGEIISVLHERT